LQNYVYKSHPEGITFAQLFQFSDESEAKRAFRETKDERLLIDAREVYQMPFIKITKFYCTAKISVSIEESTPGLLAPKLNMERMLFFPDVNFSLTLQFYITLILYDITFYKFSAIHYNLIREQPTGRQTDTQTHRQTN